MDASDVIDSDTRPEVRAIAKRMYIDHYTYGIVHACIQMQMPDIISSDLSKWEEYILNNDIGFSDRPENIFHPAGWYGIKKAISAARTFQELKNIWYKYKSIQYHWHFISLLKKQKKVILSWTTP